MNIKELALHLNISTATVSKALNNKSDISSHMKKKVMEAAIELGYRPNASARYLRSGKVNTVALLLPAVEGDNLMAASFFMRIAKGLHNSLKSSGIDPVIHITTDENEERALLERIIEQQRADAIILMDTRIDDERITWLHSLNFPFATMGRSRSLNGNFNWVDFNHSLMGQECVEFALKKGSQRIGVVTLGQESMHGSQFLEGCIAALNAADLPVLPELIFYGDKTEMSGIAAVKHFQSLEEQPDFIIFINDFQLMGAYSYLQSAPQTIPNENIICAIVSSDFSSLIVPMQCTFTIDHDVIGWKLGEAVLQAVQSDKITHTLLDIHLDEVKR
jgi:LacI family transcriptional regulator